ncbi:MAG: hypothetical protein ACI83O_000287 [Patescibacteria group bacterium]|jgi:hypothetical protein
MALLVHNKIKNERKIDRHVIKEMKMEQILGVVAMLFFALSYILNFVN